MRKFFFVPDAVDPEAHSSMMSGIRCKNRELENLMWQGLHWPAFRFRLYSLDEPSRPDLVLPWQRVAIHFHGCLWLCHQCRLFGFPFTRPEFWGAKIAQKVVRDQRARATLGEQGWKGLAIWAYGIGEYWRLEFETILDRAEQWIRGTEAEAEKIGAAPG